MLVAREMCLVVETFELGFSGYGFGGAALLIGPPRKSKETKGIIYRNNWITRFYLSSTCLLSGCSLIGTILGT